jgi:hypothetical protein
MNWFEETLLRPCPHDGIKPYCPQRAGDSLRAKAEPKGLRRRRVTLKGLGETVKRQSAALDRQSAALDASHRHILALENRLRQERRMRMAAQAKAKKPLLGRFRRG